MVRIVVIALTAAIVGLAPQWVHAGYEEGHRAAKNGLYKLAAAEFQKAAVKGDARAQYSLGIMYFDGIGVKKDRREALAWLRKAADQGHAMAIDVLKRNQNLEKEHRP